LSDRSDVVRETAGLPSSRDGKAVSNDPTEESSPFRAGRVSMALYGDAVAYGLGAVMRQWTLATDATATVEMTIPE
jgi:hypothetical protein